MRPSILLVTLLSLLACKKQPFAYILSAATPVLKEGKPGAAAEPPALVGDRMELGRGSSPAFFEVEQNGNTGFVPVDEAAIRQNIDVFQPADSEAAAYVLVEGLRVRSKPMLSGEVLSVLGKGTILPVLATGSLYSMQEGKQGRWIQIKAGKQDGFVFSAFVVLGRTKDLSALSQGGTIYEQGIVELRSLRLFNRESGQPLTAAELATCTAGRTQDGGGLRFGLISRYFQISIKQGIPYYDLTDVSCSGAPNTYVNVSAAETDVLRIESMTAYTSAARPDLSPAFIAAVSQAMNGQVDARSISVYPLPSAQSALFLVKGGRGYCFENADQIVCSQAVLLNLQDGKYTSIAVFGEPHIADLNGDGLPEVMTEYGTRGGMVYDLYSFKNGKFEAVWNKSPQFDGKLSIYGSVITTTERAWLTETEPPRELIVTTTYAMVGGEIKQTGQWKAPAPPR